ncbi:MAG TPA: glycosyltransferase family 87 protein [bacterium]|nr:glycosyltransferase family 87 protein [bacterium]
MLRILSTCYMFPRVDSSLPHDYLTAKSSGSFGLAGPVLAAVVLHAAILVVPLLQPAAFGPFGMRALHDDQIYFDYGSRALAGAVPYRDYLVEYPPLAVALFALPRLVTDRFGPYVLWFAAEMLLFDALAVYLVARRTAAHRGLPTVPARLAWYTAFLAALYPLAGTRYDLAPAAVALAGTTAWFGSRPVLGGVLAGAGALLKLFPAVLAVPAAAVEARFGPPARGRGLAAFGVVVVAGGGLWTITGGAASLGYHLGRGLQIETVWAGALMMADHFVGAVPAWHAGHNSVELVAPGAAVLASIGIPVQLAMLGAVAWRARQDAVREPIRWAAAAILAFILPGKVLSPQYLIWLVPFMPVLEAPAGRSSRWVFLFACTATTAEYLASRRLTSFELWAIALLNCRNALLVALFVLLVKRDRGEGRSDPRRSLGPAPLIDEDALGRG